MTEDLKTQVNPYSWSEASNMLFISQPLGVGFSYSDKSPGSLNPITGETEGPDFGVDGRYPVINATELDTTELAAIATWQVLQAFLSALPQLNSRVGNEEKEFNLWTESYGGHYGPTFFKYFYEQNELISRGRTNGTRLRFDTLGIGNGLIDTAIQAPYYPAFANNNTYGIKSLPDSVIQYMAFANSMRGGCQDLLSLCKTVNRTTEVGQQLCSGAAYHCRNNVENPYYQYSGRGVYDIRHPYDDPTPPIYFVDYLNQAEVQQALGVDLNYTRSNAEVLWAFARTGDFAYPVFIEDLEFVMNRSVRVALFYGDADYICNWFGGEAVSEALRYTNAKEFAKTGYVPFMVEGREYGAVREYGNFSFLRLYDAGHKAPYYQPLATLEYFRRVLGGRDVATGETVLTGMYATNGTANATHTQPFVPLPKPTSSRSRSLTASAAAVTSTTSSSA